MNEHQSDARPIPVLDHLVVNVLDRMDDAATLYRRLGFTLTPRGYHTLGSINHLAILGTNYLELVGVPAEGRQRLDIMTSPQGLNGLVFASENADATFAALATSGLPFEPPLSFSRPVELPQGSYEARFRTVRLAADRFAVGRLYFCEHLTRELVWRDEWRRHANGATEILGATLVSTRLQDVTGMFEAIFGSGAVVSDGTCKRLVVGAGSIEVVSPEAAAARFGDALPSASGDDQLVAMSLRTRSIAQTEAALEESGIRFARLDDRRAIVAAADAFGVAIEFRA
jgi:Glyoxalase-like domain